jgi:hypothetical protein
MHGAILLELSRQELTRIDALIPQDPVFQNSIHVELSTLIYMSKLFPNSARIECIVAYTLLAKYSLVSI